jgi:hypothetical protein
MEPFAVKVLLKYVTQIINNPMRMDYEVVLHIFFLFKRRKTT